MPVLADYSVEAVRASRKVVAEAFFRITGILRSRCVAEVTIDNEHPFLLYGEADGEVHCDKRLAAARVE
ncbi:hypothetical protein EVA_06588 [gut metagenome]|uniref:Uncharacterized protein n=1 Tax=gut metagenome TaxID=749906 RepID=J9GX74_9ZZZZ